MDTATVVSRDVIVIGGGVAGLSTAVFTARHGLDTLVLDSGESILRRNAHLENFPGFPAGVNGRQLLDLLEEQAAEAGCEQITATVASVENTESGFTVETDADDRYRAEYVVTATKNEVGCLEGVDGVGIVDRGKAFVDTDERGHRRRRPLCGGSARREAPSGGRLCRPRRRGRRYRPRRRRPTVLPRLGAPEGYFTDRERDLPPGCEEIGEEERRDREARSLDVMGERFAEPHPDEQITHPSLRDE